MDRKQTSDATSQQIKLDEIADDFLLRRREGQNPSIESYQQAHPELAQQIGDLLQTVQFVDSVGDESFDGQSSRSADADATEMVHKEIGSYEILGKLGEGGMGTVFRARHSKLNRTVALKMLPASKMSDQDIARFEREMASTGQLSHPNIVVAHDAGEVDGQPFLAMELLSGFDLSKVSAACSPLDVGTACELIRQAALGMQCAHSNGIVHRDIKPSNLMLTDDGVVKVLDLGLARTHGDTSSEITTTGQVMGTIDYIAPEQCADSHSVDAQADIYSLGATLYKLLVGEPPFSGPKLVTTLQKLLAITSGDPPPISSRRLYLPKELEEAVDQAIRHDPANRFASAQAFADALEPFADGSAIDSILLKTKSHKADSDSCDTVVRNQALMDTSRPIELAQSAQSAQPSPEASGARSWVMPCVLIALCFFGSLPFWLPSIMTLETDNGTIIVDVEGDPIKVTFDGERATFDDPTDGKLVRVSIDKDRDLLVFSKEGFRSFTESCEIISADQKISLRFKPKTALQSSVASVDMHQDQPPKTTKYSPSKTAATTELATALRWCFENGMEGFAYPGSPFILTPDGVPDDVVELEKVQFTCTHTDQVGKALTRLLPNAQPEELSIYGMVALTDPSLDQIAKTTRLKTLRISVPCDVEKLQRLPTALLNRLTSFGSGEPGGRSASDSMMVWLGKSCPQLRSVRLNAQDVGRNGITAISQLPLTELELYTPSPTVMRSLNRLASVNNLMLHGGAGGGMSEVDFAYLPPQLTTLRLWFLTLEEKHFQHLSGCKQLKKVTYYDCEMDMAIATEFAKSHPNVQLVDWKTGIALAASDVRKQPLPADENGRELIGWAHQNKVIQMGLWVNWDGFGKMQDSDLAGIQSLSLTNNHKNQATAVIDRLQPRLTSLKKIAVTGSTPLGSEFATQVNRFESLRDLNLFCPLSGDFDFNEFSENVSGSLTRIGLAPLGGDTDDTTVASAIDRFPRLTILYLSAGKLTNKAVNAISDSPIKVLSVSDPSDEFMHSAGKLTKVNDFTVSPRFGSQQLDVDFDHLPPGLNRLTLRGSVSGDKYLAQIAKLERLGVLTLSPPVDEEALSQFKEQRPDCTVNILPPRK